MAEITLTAKWQLHKIIVGLGFVVAEEDWVLSQEVPKNLIILPTPSCAMSFAIEWLDVDQSVIDPTDLTEDNRGVADVKFVEVIQRSDGTHLIVDGFELNNVKGYQRVNQDGLGLSNGGITLRLSNIQPPTVTPNAAEAAAIWVKALP